MTRRRKNEIIDIIVKLKEGESMAIKIIALILAVAALLMTFRGRFILEKILKRDDVSDKHILNLKIVALCLAAIAFGLVFRV